jgi:hypothetical protein
VKQLASTGPQRREDVLEIGCGARCPAERGRIECTASSGKKRKTDEAAADLEPARGDVFVWDPVTCEVQDRPQKKRGKPRAASGPGGGARRDME